VSDPKKSHDIEALIADFQRSGMRELHVKAGDVEIYLSADPGGPGLDAAPVAQVSTPAPVASSPGAAPAPVAPAVQSAQSVQSAQVVQSDADIPADGIIVRAPYLGTFYRAPKPGSPVYVEIGSVVTAETELCLVEVMKLFTAVRADVAGRVHAILANDGAMVEADQPLFVIVPA
jgi:acetyl-CoA carboxylase biotin carboxyl carrier protein